MQVVVLGAGTVGSWIAELLCQHGHVVTVVDRDPARIARINNELDVKALVGSASESSVLFPVVMQGADLCLAVTGIDEVNIVAASMAKGMGARRSVARVYAPVFRDLSSFDYQQHFGIDRMLSLEQLTAMELARAIRNPGSVAVENFARGAIEVREVVVEGASQVTGRPLKTGVFPSEVKVGSILRDGQMWIAGAEDAIEVGDHVTLIGSREAVDQALDGFSARRRSKLGVVIAGGGETGFHLAKALEDAHFDTLLVEQGAERAQDLAEWLRGTTVIQADATDRAVLEEERVGSADIFVACTGDDENNIMACVEAQEIGAKRTMAVISRPDYAQVVNRLGIDRAVSPRNVMAHQVLGFLNPGNVISRLDLGNGAIDLFEIEVRESTPATEHVLANLPLPQQCLIAAVLTEEYVRVPKADDQLRPGNRVIALIADEHADEALRAFHG